MRRRLDVLDTASRRQILRRDVRPGLAVIAGEVEWTIVRADPDHAFFERRFRNRVKRAVELFAGNVARDRFAAGPLTATGMRSKIGRNLFPRHTFVSRAMEI